MTIGGDSSESPPFVVSGELQRGAAPVLTVPVDALLEPGRDGTGARAVAHVHADLDGVEGQEARVHGLHPRAYRLHPALAGLVLAGAGDEQRPPLEVVVDLA